MLHESRVVAVNGSRHSFAARGHRTHSPLGRRHPWPICRSQHRTLDIETRAESQRRHPRTMQRPRAHLIKDKNECGARHVAEVPKNSPHVLDALVGDTQTLDDGLDD